MFLIEFQKGQFIDAERITWLLVDKEDVKFTIEGDNESFFEVADEFKCLFLNNLQVINHNHNIESY